jgi:hypothetical protein
MLNEHAAGQGSGHLLVIEYYVLQHVLAIILCLKHLEPPEEGKSIEFPRKHAILADCTTIDCTILIAGVRYPRLKPCAQPHREFAFLKFDMFCLKFEVGN